jgi:hypothetical protein
MRQQADAQVVVEQEERADAVLGWYPTADGRRQVRAVSTVEEGLCVIDQGADRALLVEPRLEGMAEARALAADYLSVASERGEPQTRQPWPAGDDAEQGDRS